MEPVGRPHSQSNLQARLDAAFAAIDRKRVIVARLEAGSADYAGVSSDPQDQAEPAEWAFTTGCITKLFTGALVEREVRAGTMRRHDRVARFVVLPRDDRPLADITLRDLIEHTHGLDDSAIRHAPLHADGTVDLRSLLEGLEPFAPPGEVYSYSNIGAWILAAILERLNDLPFAEQLVRNLFEPIGITARHVPPMLPSSPEPLCPSMGGGLAVSAKDMVTFLKSESLSRLEAWPPPGDHSGITALPGWNPLERGIYRGWKHHGGDWFGHNSAWPDASGMVRVEPHRGAAIVVASKTHPAPVVAAKLFAGVLPEYTKLRFPRVLPPDVVAQLELDDYCGSYRTAGKAFAIEQRTRDASLHLLADGTDCVLLPAENDVFYARPAVFERAFVQFVQRDGERFRYLWDGRRLFRNTTAYTEGR